MLEQMFNLETEGIDLPSAKLISEEISRNNSQKFDYIKYRQAVKSLKSMNMDEMTAIQSTLTTASTMGVSVDDIAASAESFKNIVQNEEAKFNQAMHAQYKLKVEDKKHELSDKEELIKINEQKIKALKDENDLLKSKLEGIQEEIKLNDQKIQHKKSVFEKTILKIQEWINNDLTQLKSLKK